jgi:Zn-dependent protease
MSPLLIAMTPLLAFAKEGDTFSDDIGAKIIVLAVGILAITLHEAGHAYAADFVGDPVPRHFGKVTLNPLPHIATSPFMTLILPVVTWVLNAGFFPMGGGACPVSAELSRHRKKSFFVAFAGPGVNLAMVVGFTALLFLPFMRNMDSLSYQVVEYLGLCVLWIAIFNLLPIPPMDGARMLSAAFPALQKPFQAAEQFGIMLVILVGWPLFPIIALPVLRLYLHTERNLHVLVFG